LKGFLGALVQIGFDGPALIEPFYRPLREKPPEKALQLVSEAMRKCLALAEGSG
jgi:sugar phosphate isomerase/epimerase